jgi:hypothetical protein
MKTKRPYLWISLFIVISLSACSKLKAVGKDSFRIYILQDNWSDLNLGYELEESWPILEKADLNKTIRVITPDDIQAYNWSTQTITLTRKASTPFNELPYETKLDISNFQPAFVVVLNDQRLYGGCIITSGTAKGLHFPVILTDLGSNPVVFTIRPYLYPFLRYDQVEPSAKQIIEIKEVYDLFDRLGKLTH